MLTKRTYVQTHPWIKFELDTRNYTHEMWMMLGEAASKANHIGGVPLAPEAAKKLYDVFLAKGALATTAIEGNTLTEDQVVRQVQGTLKLPPSQQYLQQEVQNIIDACNTLVADLQKSGPVPITTEFCCHLNAMVLKDLKLDDDAGKAGEIRRHSVVVGSVYRGAPPEDCKFLLDETCRNIEEMPYGKENNEYLAILAALFAHIYMALIHPFGDGNGRTARLLEFYILLSAGFPMPTGQLLSNHYNKTRTVYYRELDKISKSGGETKSFVRYALEGFIDGLKEQIGHIRKEQFAVAWVNYVHDQFQGRKTAADQRKRELVLSLGRINRSARINEIMDLTPTLAREYSGKTDKTLTRDLNALIQMGLVERKPGRRVKASTGKLRAFLPWKNKRPLESTESET
ncbi:Fic family protein [Mesorhizobium sp. MSK_1335]|uniref:Fic family protein n=1 Tax=Mesorhizobium montanum TaxID=3072323 RepID=A0ABU4ZLR0_9HYPH|nr:Fic family protein [Mesorhizobium sp. MSK_1335]MDX8526304.1 Fic family protein [Mesorhizobium sp. MSK_1335]